MLYYNSPDHKEQRVNVKPLSLEEMKELVKYINIEHSDENRFKERVQRLIWDYENLSHMRETQPKWISVENLLPEPLVEVLLLKSDGNIEVDSLCSKSNKYWLNSSNLDNAIYWMPLPEPPIK